MNRFALALLPLLCVSTAHAGGDDRLTKEQFESLKALNGLYDVVPSADCDLRKKVSLTLNYSKESQTFSFEISDAGFSLGGNYETQLEPYAPRGVTDPKHLLTAKMEWDGDHSVKIHSNAYTVTDSTLALDWTVGQGNKIESVNIDIDWSYRPTVGMDAYPAEKKAKCLLKPRTKLGTFEQAWTYYGDEYPSFD